MNQIQSRLNHKLQLNNNILFYFSLFLLIELDNLQTFIRIISTGLFGKVDCLIRGVYPKHTPLYNLRRKKTEQVHLKALKPSG